MNLGRKPKFEFQIFPVTGGKVDLCRNLGVCDCVCLNHSFQVTNPIECFNICDICETNLIFHAVTLELLRKNKHWEISSMFKE